MAETSSIVGREHEQQELRALLSMAQAGNGRLALVSGEAGIGKTTLVDALASEAEQRGVLLLSGGCYDLTNTPPYGPWLDMARGYQRLLDRAPQSKQALPPLPRSLTSAEGLATAGGRDVIFEDVASFLAAAGAVQPLLLVIEDLHWSDNASLDILRVVARQIADIPVLLLVTYRANEVGRDSHLFPILPLLVREARAERFDLRRLKSSEIETLVAARYELSVTDRQMLMDYLERRAEGNPFYVLELLRGLEYERLLVLSDDRWQVGEIDSPHLPALLRQTIHSRLARLADTVQERLSAASIIGQDVPLRLWGSMLGMSDEDVLHTADLASEAQLVDVLPDSASFRFHHALIREALYQAIRPSQRRALHRTAGELLAALPDPDPDSVAWHLQMAGDERAPEWLLLASERAQRSYAWTNAADRLVAADAQLSTVAGSRDLGWLRYRIGRLRRHSNVSDAIRWLREAVRLGEQAADPALIAYARFDLGHVQVLAGDYTRGIDQMMAGDTLLDSLARDQIMVSNEIEAWVADTLPFGTGSDKPRAAAASVNPRTGTLIQWLVEPGRLREARVLGEKYVTDVDSLIETNEQIISSAADAWYGLGRIYAAFGDIERARTATWKAVECYRSIEHHMLVAFTLRNDLLEILAPYETTNVVERRRLATLAEDSFQRATGALPSTLPASLISIQPLILEGDWEAIREMLTPVAEPGVAIEPVRHMALAWLARLAREQGNIELAWTYVHEVVGSGPATEPGSTSLFRGIEAQLVAVDLALDEGNHDLAASWLNALDRWIAWSGVRRYQSDAALGWARHSRATGDLKRARRQAVEALRLANDPRQPLAELAAHQFLGELDRDASRLADADEHLAEALALADACDSPYERARTLIALAALKSITGDRDGALEMLDIAIPIVERLGAIPELERARLVASRLEPPAGEPGTAFGLSRRETEVLKLVAQGLTDAEVADQLYISYRTVTTHLTSIFNKLGVNSRVTATRIAVEQGIV